MILLKLIRAIVLYIRYTEFKFTKFTYDPIYPTGWELKQCTDVPLKYRYTTYLLKQCTDVPLKYRYTTYFFSRTKVGCIYQAVKRSRLVLSNLFNFVP